MRQIKMKISLDRLTDSGYIESVRNGDGLRRTYEELQSDERTNDNDLLRAWNDNRRFLGLL